MNTILIIYCVFSYLFMAGIVLTGWKIYNQSGLIVTLIFSPIMMPFISGIYLGDINK